MAVLLTINCPIRSLIDRIKGQLERRTVRMCWKIIEITMKMIRLSKDDFQWELFSFIVVFDTYWWRRRRETFWSSTKLIWTFVCWEIVSIFESFNLRSVKTDWIDRRSKVLFVMLKLQSDQFVWSFDWDDLLDNHTSTYLCKCSFLFPFTIEICMINVGQIHA